MKTLKNVFNVLTVGCLFLASHSLVAATGEEALSLEKILENRHVNCIGFKPSLQPRLNFETIAPKVLLNKTETQVSLHLTAVYYRCEQGLDGEGQFKIAVPSEPYQYEVEQLDGTLTSVKVNQQRYRFSALVGAMKNVLPDITKGLPARVETQGLSEYLRFDIPMSELLDARQRLALRQGKTLQIPIKVISAISTDYRVGQQTQGSTEFVPATAMNWLVSFKVKNRHIEVNLDKVSRTTL